MIATRKMIRNLREKARMQIGGDLQALILKRFGTEPYPYTYTEQDLYEQIRKLVMRFNESFPRIPDPTQPFLSGTAAESTDGLGNAETRGGNPQHRHINESGGS